MRLRTEEEGDTGVAGEEARWQEHQVPVEIGPMLSEPTGWQRRSLTLPWRWAFQLRRWRLRAVRRRTEASRVLVEVAGLHMSELPPQAQLELQEEERARLRLQEARRHLAARMAAAGLGAAARLRAAAVLLQRAVLDTADLSRVEGNLECRRRPTGGPDTLAS